MLGRAVNARFPSDRLIDELLALVVFAKVQRMTGNNVGDRLKAMKHLFLPTHRLFARRAQAFSFNFYKYTHGPFTPEAYEAWEELAIAGLVTVSEDKRGPITVTSAGMEFADAFIFDVERRRHNNVILAEIDATVDATASLPTRDILDRVYDMVVTPIGWHEQITIADVPEGVSLTKTIESGEATIAIDVPDRWPRKVHLAYLRGMAAMVGEDKPIFGGLTIDELEDLDKSLEHEEQDLLDMVDLDRIRSEHGIR